MKIRTCYYLLLILVMIGGGCVEPYQPSVVSQDYKYLVVDGYIDLVNEFATVELSRTLPLYSKDPVPPETNATVSIESDNGSVVILEESKSGFYEKRNVAFSASQQYRLIIRTTDNQEYQSDYITIKSTPQIDSVYWEAENDGLRIYVNTHDDTGNSRYYKWKFHETWQYSSSFSSFLKLVNGKVVTRPQEESINTCWGSNSSKNILVGSSGNLKLDVIDHYLITNVAPGRKLSEKYSILVSQQAITKEAYDYWQQLQQTTESLGSLFDPMPYELSGNIRCTSNPSLRVLGYFSGGSTTEKRIFIKPSDIPSRLRFFQQPYCEYDTIPIDQVPNLTDNYLLITFYGYPDTLGYLTSSSICIDCRVLGGTTTKPLFWE